MCITSGVPAHVLIVDDEPSLRDVMADIMVGEGYRVTTAVDGIRGLERLREDRPDLIVLDLMMPVLDGWAFVEACREMADGDIPIIGVSACMTADIAARLRNQGVEVCFAKPFDLGELLDCARSMATPGQRLHLGQQPGRAPGHHLHEVGRYPRNLA